jgi:hypothetical protein
VTREKKPYYRWYPGDLKRDSGVRSCPFEVRSIWREMLDLMHDGEPRGYLTAGGVPIRTGKDLAIAIGGGVTPRTCQRAIDMLCERKVCGVTPEGVIFSRRMVRDDATDEARAEGGSKGGAKGESKGDAKGGVKGPPSPAFPPHPPITPIPGTGTGSGRAREAFAGKRLSVPKFLDDEFVARLNGQFFDLTAFYLALDQRLAQTGETWDLRWIREQFAAESPAPDRRKASRHEAEFTPAERKKAEDFRRRVWGGCRHDPRCETSTGCIAAIIQGWRAEEVASA